uniref:Uncharacterized protein n=1 Tax=viral metagenome TaxID=1070528 RepID=A0A6M3MDU4_9ZZZZ
MVRVGSNPLRYQKPIKPINAIVKAIGILSIIRVSISAAPISPALIDDTSIDKRSSQAGIPINRVALANTTPNHSVGWWVAFQISDAD